MGQAQRVFSEYGEVKPCDNTLWSGLCQGGTGLVVTGIPHAAWGVRDGISERATTELRFGGGRGVGLMKELG